MPGASSAASPDPARTTGGTRRLRYADPARARAGRLLTLVGYFALLGLILAWFTWIAPPVTMPRAFPIIALAVPLLFPLRGLLHGRRYTHQWTSFLSLFYFAVGVDAWFNAAAGVAWLGAATVLFSLVLFVGTVVYARYTASTPSAPTDDEAGDRAAPPSAAKSGGPNEGSFTGRSSDRP